MAAALAIRIRRSSDFCIALLLACNTVYIIAFLGYFYGFMYSALGVCAANWAAFAGTVHFLRKEEARDHPKLKPGQFVPLDGGTSSHNDLLMEQLLPDEDA